MSVLLDVHFDQCMSRSFFFKMQVMLKGETIQKMHTEHQESFAKHEANVKVIQDQEDNIRDLKDEIAILNTKVN